MRIAFLSCGSFMHIKPYVEYFKARGHAVYWITYDHPLWDLGVPVFDISRGANPGKDWTKWRYLLSVPQLRRLLRKIHVDIIHGHYITSAGLLCMLSGFRPYVLTVHGTDIVGSVNSPSRRYMLKRIMAGCRLINVVSEDLGSMVQRCGVPKEKLILATPGVDLDRFKYKPASRLDGPVRLICTRTLGEVYDPWTIVRACLIMASGGMDFTMTFAAAGPLQDQLRSYCDEHGLSSRVVFKGGYENSRLPSLLHEHDVFVSASKSDGTSLCLLEAMACGIFPIMSRIPANTSWIEDGKTGYLFDVGQADELARKIMKIPSAKELIAQAAKQNRQHVEERAGRQQNMKKLEQAFVNLLARNARTED